jgi:hypothetical protein
LVPASIDQKNANRGLDMIVSNLGSSFELLSLHSSLWLLLRGTPQSGR